MKNLLPALLAAALIADAAAAQTPGRAANPRVETYKTVGDVKLDMHIFTPDDHQPTDARPAVVFFFGGGWRSGSPKQFFPHCQYLASRGMAAMAADYRVSSRHGVKANSCVADAKSAIRWVRENADRLGVDPRRIVAAGGSAGGHLAACTGTVAGFDDPQDDQEVSAKPNAMILFNPVMVLAPVEGESGFLGGGVGKNLRKRMGADPRELSPYHHASKEAPPTLVFHGKDDSTVPYWTAERFVEALKEAGVRAELDGYQGAGHGFFNHGRGDGSAYVSTVRRMDEFLQSLGYLQGEATVGAEKR